MKHHIVVFAALAGSLLAGCADQSSLNAPVTAVSPSHQLTDAGSTSFAGFTIDEIVTDDKGRRFVVQGTINCDFSRDEASYTLVTVASLTVVSDPDEKGLNASINSNEVNRDAYTGAFDIAKMYKLGGFPSGSHLRVALHVGDTITIESISIVVGREDEIGIEAD